MRWEPFPSFNSNIAYNKIHTHTDTQTYRRAKVAPIMMLRSKKRVSAFLARAAGATRTHACSRAATTLALPARPLVAGGGGDGGGGASGAVLFSAEPLSLWGGVDAESGVVIESHHPLRGRSVAGRVLAMPSGRGSCTGSQEAQTLPPSTLPRHFLDIS